MTAIPGARVWRMVRVVSGVGSSTRTGWNRRSRAASFSDHPTVLLLGGGADELEPARARAGLRRLAASMAPSALPAPDEGVELVQEEDHIPCPGHLGQDVFHPVFKLPRYLVPAITEGRLRDRRRFCRRASGTCPWAIRWARASTTAVLPTPGSPGGRGCSSPAQEDLDEPVELLRPAGDGIIAPAACLLDHVQGVLVQQPGGGGGRSAVALPPGPGGGSSRCPGPGRSGGKGGPAGSLPLPAGGRRPVFLPQQAQEQVAAVYLAVAQAAGLAYGGLHAPLQLRGEGAAPWQRAPVPQASVSCASRPWRVRALGGQQPPGAALAVLQQTQEQMFAAHGIVAQALGQGAGGFQSAAGGGVKVTVWMGIPPLCPVGRGRGRGRRDGNASRRVAGRDRRPSKAGLRSPNKRALGCFPCRNFLRVSFREKSLPKSSPKLRKITEIFSMILNCILRKCDTM